MESIDQAYPPFSPASSSESSSPPLHYPRSNPSPPSADAADRAREPTAAPSFDGWSSNLLAQPSQPHLYSPTRAEIESHPIRQRLSVSRDEVTTGYGRASAQNPDHPQEPSEERSLAREQKQAQEGSERLFDAMSSEASAPQVGDAVTYSWGSGQPGGTVSQVESKGDVTMETKSGNEVKKSGDPENPALYIERDGHDVVKKASEVEVEEKADQNKQNESSESEKKTDGEEKKADSEEKKEDKEEEEKPKENGEAENKNAEPQTGDKRKADEPAEENKDEETNGEAKKQKKDDEPKENGEKPKKKGRPAKLTDADGNPRKKTDTKKRPPKKAATESGEPRRSGRNANKES